VSRVAYTSSPSTTTTFGTLCKYVSQLGIIFVFVWMMNTYVPTQRVSFGTQRQVGLFLLSYTPLQIVWSWILVFAVRTEWTYVAWGLMYESMPYHLILPLEAFAAFASRAVFHWTVVRSI